MADPAPTPTPKGQIADPPVVNNEGQLIKRGRIGNTDALLALHAKSFNDDRHRSRDRALIQQLLDNLPPVDQKLMEQAGKGNCSNFNPGDAETVFSEELSPYVGLAKSGRTLFSVPIRDIGTDMEQARWGTVIAEEATDTIRAWPGFLSTWQQGVMFMKRDGVSFAMHDSPIDWRWKVHNQEELKYPENTRIGVDNFTYITMEIPMQPSDLYAIIQDDKFASKSGWNIEMARRALMEASPDNPRSDNWEAWERSIKNNDFFLNGAASSNPVVKLVYGYCKELDGKVSQYITRQGDEGKPFIFKREAKFDGMSKFLYPIIENLGSNGTYHAIRGVGHKIYSKAMQIALLVNKFADMVDFDTTPIIQGVINADTDDIETIQFGYFSVYPNTYSFPERRTSNYSNSIIPAIEYFRQMMQKATAKTSQSAIQGDEVSRYVLDAAMRNDAQVTGLSEFLFYASMEPLFREVVRRLSRPDYEPTTPGGIEAADFRKRCHQRGVTEEVLKHIDFSRIEMNRVIGGGNENVRALKLQSLAPIAQGFDPVGKAHYQHDIVSAILDEKSADVYSPVTSVVRLPDDAGLAQVENNDLIAGMEVVPLPGQNDEVHCMIHIRKLNDFGSLVENQSSNLMEVTPPMRRILDHIQMHIENLPVNSPNTKEIIQVHQQYLGMVENGELQIAREQEAQANEAAQNGAQQPGMPPSPEQQMQQEKANFENLKSVIRAQEMSRALLNKNRMYEMQEEDRANKLAFDKAVRDAKAAAEIQKATQPKSE